VAQPTLDAVQHLRRVAEEAGCSLAQLALAWALRRPEISSAIVGASRPAQLEENVLAADLDIESSLLEAASEVLHDVAVYDADVAPGMD
jgi:aryl-alcohol dehydrogenase-like predicted oxidoreductase